MVVLLQVTVVDGYKLSGRGCSISGWRQKGEREINSRHGEKRLSKDVVAKQILTQL